MNDLGFDLLVVLILLSFSTSTFGINLGSSSRYSSVTEISYRIEGNEKRFAASAVIMSQNTLLTARHVADGLSGKELFLDTSEAERIATPEALRIAVKGPVEFSGKKRRGYTFHLKDVYLLGEDIIEWEYIEQADLAVMVFENNTFKKELIASCPDKSAQKKSLVNQKIYIVGWGDTELEFLPTPNFESILNNPKKWLFKKVRPKVAHGAIVKIASYDRTEVAYVSESDLKYDSEKELLLATSPHAWFGDS